MKNLKDWKTDEILRKYPRVCAHIIAHSLGHSTPTGAASILKYATMGVKGGCEWVSHCYLGNNLKCLQHTIRWRHSHKGYMASYKDALYLVRGKIKTSSEPVFASWM